MHPRNRHQSRYDLQKLAKETPELNDYIFTNDYGDETLDFSDNNAVITLNRALLKSDYGIKYWDLPKEFLCPPIPGRADYIHSVADLFSKPKGLRVLDIGVGANCIYPLIGYQEYGWNFVGSDVNKKALTNADKIIAKNNLSSKIETRLQSDSSKIFENIIGSDEHFDLTICNPPFQESAEEASKGTARKWTNLGKKPVKSLNFGGGAAELWYPGGERAFIMKMIKESKTFAENVGWFTTLVSKDKNLFPLKKKLENMKARFQVVEMSQGNKKSRVLAWTFGHKS